MSRLAHDSLEAVLGKEYRKRVKLYEKVPKGLISNDQLIVASGEKQVLTIYGSLSDAEISAAIKDLFGRLAVVRDATFVPVVIEFYCAEVFRRQEDGSSSRGSEVLIKREAFSIEKK